MVQNTIAKRLELLVHSSTTTIIITAVHQDSSLKDRILRMRIPRLNSDPCTLGPIVVKWSGDTLVDVPQFCGLWEPTVPHSLVIVEHFRYGRSNESFRKALLYRKFISFAKALQHINCYRSHN